MNTECKINYFNKWTLINLIHQITNKKLIKNQIKKYYSTSSSSYFEKNFNNSKKTSVLSFLKPSFLIDQPRNQKKPFLPENDYQ